MTSTRALVVGISDYGRLNRPLPGCGNDMLDWRDTLVTQGVSVDGIRLLADARASRNALIERLTWLLEPGAPDGHRIFVFAGHGARLRRRSTDTGDLDDNLDEALVLHPGEAGDIDTFLLYDDDLREILGRSDLSPDVRITVVLDACHAGGMERDILLINGEVELDQPVPRCWDPPADVRHRAFAVSDDTPTRRFGTSLQKKARHLIVAAAKPEESAWDARLEDGQRHGVFSYHMTRALRRTPAEPISVLVAQVLPLVASRFPQHPLLLGNPERYSFPLL